MILSHSPAGASTKQFLHFGQNHRAGKFRQYDYGFGNLGKYGSWKPPEYNLKNGKAPMAFYYGSKDNFVDVNVSI